MRRMSGVVTRGKKRLSLLLGGANAKGFQPIAPALPPKTEERARHMFEVADADTSGILDPSGVTVALNRLGSVVEHVEVSARMRMLWNTEEFNLNQFLAMAATTQYPATNELLWREFCRELRAGMRIIQIDLKMGRRRLFHLSYLLFLECAPARKLAYRQRCASRRIQTWYRMYSTMHRVQQVMDKVLQHIRVHRAAICFQTHTRRCAAVRRFIVRYKGCVVKVHDCHKKGTGDWFYYNTRTGIATWSPPLYRPQDLVDESVQTGDRYTKPEMVALLAPRRPKKKKQSDAGQDKEDGGRRGGLSREAEEAGLGRKRGRRGRRG